MATEKPLNWFVPFPFTLSTLLLVVFVIEKSAPMNADLTGHLNRAVIALTFASFLCFFKRYVLLFILIVQHFGEYYRD